MVAAIDPAPYITAARCTFCNIPPGLIWYAILAALIDIANGDPVPTDTDELLNEARCLQSCIPHGLLPYTLLAAIEALSSGGGLGTQQVFEGRDPAPPDDVTKPAVNYPIGGGALTQWDGANWV